MDKLPKEVLNTMHMFFDEGKFVNDFRVIGNSNGYSVTIHFCNEPSNDLDTWSPGIKTKSPSTRAYDMNRRIRWGESSKYSPTVPRPVACGLLSSTPTASGVDKSTSYDVNIDSDMTENVNNSDPIGSGLSVDNNERNENTLHDVTDDSIVNDTESLHGLRQDSDGLSSGEVDQGSPNSIETDIKDCAKDDGLTTETEDSTTDDKDEIQYKCNILKHSRNKSFNKIVHDTRNSESKVYGLSDDVIVLVDELNMKYESWAIHDKEQNERCAEIYNLLHKWPRANSSKCKYGYETLSVILPEIVEHQRQCCLAMEDGE